MHGAPWWWSCQMPIRAARHGTQGHQLAKLAFVPGQRPRHDLSARFWCSMAKKHVMTNGPGQPKAHREREGRGGQEGRAVVGGGRAWLPACSPWGRSSRKRQSHIRACYEAGAFAGALALRRSSGRTPARGRSGKQIHPKISTRVGG